MRRCSDCPRMWVVQDPGRKPQEPCLSLWRTPSFWVCCRTSEARCDNRYRPPRESDTARYPPVHKDAGCLHHEETGHPYTAGEGPAYAEPLFGLSGNPNRHLGNHPRHNAAREVGPHREVSSRSPRPERNIHYENQGTVTIRQSYCPNRSCAVGVHRTKCRQNPPGRYETLKNITGWGQRKR